MGKITSYTEDITPTADDLIFTVNSPGVIPGNKKVSFGNLFLNAPPIKVAGHSAFGNDAGIDKAWLPGTPATSVLDCREIYTGDGTSGEVNLQISKLELNPSANINDAYILSSRLTTNVANTKDVGFLFGIYNEVYHFGSGNITSLCNLILTAGNSGAGNVAVLDGIFIDAYNDGSGIVTDLHCLKLGVGNYGSGSVTNMYGLYIYEVTGGTSVSYNIYSAGASSRNWFEGSMEFGTFTAGIATESIGYITIKDSLGNTRKLMVQA